MFVFRPGDRKPPARRRVYRGKPRETPDDVPIQAPESTPNPNNYTDPEGSNPGDPEDVGE